MITNATTDLDAMTAETCRLQAEAARISAEASRLSAENSRMLAAKIHKSLEFDRRYPWVPYAMIGLALVLGGVIGTFAVVLGRH